MLDGVTYRNEGRTQLLPVGWKQNSTRPVLRIRARMMPLKVIARVRPLLDDQPYAVEPFRART